MGMVHGIKHEATFGAYHDVAVPIIEAAGGKMVWFSQDIQAAAGDWAPMAMVLFEFESSEQAHKWYNSPEYQAVIGQRLSSTDSNTVFINVE